MRTTITLDDDVAAKIQLIRLKPGYTYDKVEDVVDHLDTPRRLR